jgi:hypothetical protein
MEDKQSQLSKKPYEIIDIQELNRVADTGGLERYYRHKIKTRGGVKLTVDIDEKDFTPDKVNELLLARADNADKILKL